MLEEFKHICRLFHQDFPIDVTEDIEMIREAVRALEPDRRRALRSYLDDLLSGRYTDDELQDIWFASPADVYFPEPGELQKVLRLLRSMSEGS